MRKIGFTPKEARGAVTLLLIFAIAAGYKAIHSMMLYDQAEELIQNVVVDEPANALFEFDPNTAELPDLMRLGLTKQQAVSIIRYREYGKVYRIKEDLYTCYGMTDSMYYRLEPYIVISSAFRVKRSEGYVDREKGGASYNRSYDRARPKQKILLPASKFLVDTVGVNYLVAIGALSRRQAEVFVKWRDLAGIADMDELRDCYVVSDSLATALESYVVFSSLEEEESEEKKLVDLNKADSTELRSVYGIGEKSAVAILEYRDLLGGFYSVEQLSELKMVTESNYEKIIQQISCDSCDISKIDVNFASAKTIKGHPYITDKILRRLLKVRELKGGWSTVEEMIVDDIFNEEEAARVRPYLLFEDFKPRQVTGDEFF